MPCEETRHDAILEAVLHSGVISELGEKQGGHFKYELELELIVYGRNYDGKKVGPYARLLFYEPGKVIFREGEWRNNTFYILIDGLLTAYADGDQWTGRKLHDIPPRTVFGVRSFLSGQPRKATVVVSSPAEAKVLEINRPAFRLLHKLGEFSRQIDEKYCQHGLTSTLDDVQHECSKVFGEELRKELEKAGRFAVYGRDHILFREGDPIDRLIFIKSGWARRVRDLASKLEVARDLAAEPALADLVTDLDDDVGLDFLGAGNWLGLETFCEENQMAWKYSATVLARTEVLEITIAHVRSNPALVTMIKEYFPPFSNADDRPPEPPANKLSMAAVGKEIATGVVEATNLLVMDMDKCVRCGNCSLACHQVHGQSRLVRRGIHIERQAKPNSRSTQHVLLPSVCLHCQDPECLTGCPTGAIGRFANGQIDIDPKTCIGCGDCATQCPYDAISMIPRTSPPPPPQPRFGDTFRSWFRPSPPAEPDPVKETDDLLAIKCNLCENTPLNPKGAKGQAYSCQENCPTGALVRANPLDYFAEAKNGLGIDFEDRTRPIGRNIHAEDAPARYINLVGVLALIAFAWAALWGASRYTLDGHLAGTWLTVRWVTGLLGLGGMAALMTYPARKKIYRRRAGPLRYWMQVHVYLGLTAGVLLLTHAGRDSGGLLTSLLLVSFDVAIASGLFGIVCYLVVPRIMTDIEGDPLLIEDLRLRREELRRKLSLFDTRSDELRRRIGRKMCRRFFSFRYLLRQYLRREELTKLLKEAREEFKCEADALGDSEAHRSVTQAVEDAATLRRVDSLIYLHQLLKLWLAPHVISISVMLALMVVHVVQVVLFTVR
jgi:Fe-S-cluster-containing dehydrogenase component/CRP-like cAMP-binding protein